MKSCPECEHYLTCFSLGLRPNGFIVRECSVACMYNNNGNSMLMLEGVDMVYADSGVRATKLLLPHHPMCLLTTLEKSRELYPPRCGRLYTYCFTGKELENIIQRIQEYEGDFFGAKPRK